jgi:hypothetical protein
MYKKVLVGWCCLWLLASVVVYFIAENELEVVIGELAVIAIFGTGAVFIAFCWLLWWWYNK